MILKNIFLYFIYKINIINFIRDEHGEKKMKGYIHIDYVNKSQLKYIVEKRYKSEQGIYFKRRVKDFDFSIVLNNCYKFYKIKIYNRTTGGIATDFKIINEIDYRQFLKSSNKKEQILSIYKNHETEVLDEFIKNDDPNKKTIN